MPTDKPRFTITVDAELDRAIEDYKYRTRAKNKTQAVIELMEIGMDSLMKELAQKEKAPAPEGAEAKEVVSLEETNAVLVEMGYIRQGEQITDADLAFLEHIGGLMDAWFSRKHS